MDTTDLIIHTFLSSTENLISKQRIKRIIIDDIIKERPELSHSNIHDIEKCITTSIRNGVRRGIFQEPRGPSGPIQLNYRLVEEYLIRSRF